MRPTAFGPGVWCPPMALSARQLDDGVRFLLPRVAVNVLLSLSAIALFVVATR